MAETATPFPKTIPGAGLVGFGGPGVMYYLKENGVTVPPELVAVVGIVSAVALLIAGVQFVRWCWQSIKEHQDTPGSAIQKLASFVRPRLISMVLAIVAIAGVLLITAAILGAVASRNPVESKAAGSQSEIKAPKQQTEFLKNIGFNYDSQLPLGISAVVGVTVDRLRVIVDSSPETTPGQFQLPAQPAHIKELKDIVRGERINIQLVYLSPTPIQAGPIWTSNYSWGDPSKHIPVTRVNRARIVIIGPDGAEQHIYFLVIQGMQNQSFMIIREQDHDWIREWRAKEGS